MNIGVDLRPLINTQITGVGVYLLENLKRILELDHKNHYKLFFNSLTGLDKRFVSEIRNEGNAKIYNFHYPNKLFNSSLLGLKRPFLDRLMGGCDLFWFPNFNFWQTSAGCKNIITVHDLSFIRIPWAYSLKMRCWHKLVNPRLKLNQAKKIIAVSGSTKNDLIDIYKIEQSKIEVIYPGVEPAKDSEVNKPLPSKYLLFLGTLEPRKNLPAVIKVFEKVQDNDLYLVIAGGRGWLYNNIYKLVGNSLKKSKIIFYDYIDAQDRWRLYQNAQILLWPSFYEGFGFPAVEAMSRGCPVITSANSSLPEVVGRAALLIDPYNLNEMVKAVELLLNNQALRQSLITKGYEQSKKFNWQKSAQQTLELFNQQIF
jgi:glycosyltransferase involved in cell wall biosynthesis